MSSTMISTTARRRAIFKELDKCIPSLPYFPKWGGSLLVQLFMEWIEDGIFDNNDNNLLSDLAVASNNNWTKALTHLFRAIEGWKKSTQKIITRSECKTLLKNISSFSGGESNENHNNDTEVNNNVHDDVDNKKMTQEYLILCPTLFGDKQIDQFFACVTEMVSTRLAISSNTQQEEESNHADEEDGEEVKQTKK